MKPFSLAVIAGTSEATDLIRMLPESWNITHPEVLRDIHRAYRAAGQQP